MKYFPDQFQIVQRNLRQHGLDPDSVDFRTKTSREAFADAAARRESFDFILIDACHKLLDVTADLRWTRLLAVNGVVCLHDYTPIFPGVTCAGQQFHGHAPKLRENRDRRQHSRPAQVSAASRPEVRLGNWLHAYFWYTPLQISASAMLARNRAAAAAHA